MRWITMFWACFQGCWWVVVVMKPWKTTMKCHVFTGFNPVLVVSWFWHQKKWMLDDVFTGYLLDSWLQMALKCNVVFLTKHRFLPCEMIHQLDNMMNLNRFHNEIRCFIVKRQKTKFDSMPSIEKCVMFCVSWNPRCSISETTMNYDVWWKSVFWNSSKT